VGRTAARTRWMTHKEKLSAVIPKLPA
jgi:hypothetical protein